MSGRFPDDDTLDPSDEFLELLRQADDEATIVRRSQIPLPATEDEESAAAGRPQRSRAALALVAVLTLAVVAAVAVFAVGGFGPDDTGQSGGQESAALSAATTAPEAPAADPTPTAPETVVGVPDAPGRPSVTEGDEQLSASRSAAARWNAAARESACLGADPLCDGQLSVSWDAPAGNSAPVTGYEVRWWGPSEGRAWADGTSYTVHSLVNGHYQVQVRARNSEGWGDWSPDASYTVSVTAHSAAGESSPSSETVVGVPDAPRLAGVTGGDGLLSVSWDAPSGNGAAIEKYDILVDGSDVSVATGTYGVTSTTVTGLSNGVTYTVQVRARNSAGWGDWSQSAHATPRGRVSPRTTLPPEPEPPAAPLPPGPPSLSPGDGRLWVLWQAPVGNGADVAGYEVRWRQVSGSWGDGGRYMATRARYTIPDLVNGLEYEVQVRAHNSDDRWSDWSQSAHATPNR